MRQLSLGVYFCTFRRWHCLHLQSLPASALSDPEDEDITILRNVVDYLPNCTAPHPVKT